MRWEHSIMKDAAYVFRRISTLMAVVVLTLTLMAAVTGTLLSFNYEPAAGAAFTSLAQITTDANFGWLIRKLHDLAGNGLIGVALVQIVVMFIGERFRPSWLTAWVSGIFLALVAIGLSWTAIILDWSQIGFWRLKVELGIIESIPFVGTQIRDVLTGGGGVSTPTVLHMYMLHSYILPLVAVGLAIAHLGGLLVQEREMQRAIALLPGLTTTSELGSGVTPGFTPENATARRPDSDNPGAEMTA
jgi:cytochrome b6